MRKGARKTRPATWWSTYVESATAPVPQICETPATVRVDEPSTPVPVERVWTARVSNMPDEIAGIDSDGALVYFATRCGCGYRGGPPALGRPHYIRSVLEAQRNAVAFGAVEVRSRHHVAQKHNGRREGTNPQAAASEAFPKFPRSARATNSRRVALDHHSTRT